LNTNHNGSGVRCCQLATFSYGTHLAVTGSDDGLIRVWDGRSQNGLAMTLRGHDGAVKCLQAGSLVLPTLCSGGEDGTVRIWDMRLIGRKDSNRLYRNSPRSNQNSHNNKRSRGSGSSGSSGGSGGIGGRTDALLVMDDHDGKPVQCLSWAWNKIVSAGDSKKVIVHSMHDGNVLFTGNGHQDTVTDVCMDESHFMSCSLDSEIRAWFAPTKK